MGTGTAPFPSAPGQGSGMFPYPGTPGAGPGTSPYPLPPGLSPGTAPYPAGQGTGAAPYPAIPGQQAVPVPSSYTQRPPAGSVMVYINGGLSFPFLTQSYPIRYRPGLTVYEALRETGLVTLSVNGQPISVGNVHLGGRVHYSISVNGKPIPPAFLNAPIQPGDMLQMYVFYR
jgi:hypothetical protein